MYVSVHIIKKAMNKKRHMTERMAVLLIAKQKLRAEIRRLIQTLHGSVHYSLLQCVSDWI